MKTLLSALLTVSLLGLASAGFASPEFGDGYRDRPDGLHDDRGSSPHEGPRGYAGDDEDGPFSDDGDPEDRFREGRGESGDPSDDDD